MEQLLKGKRILFHTHERISPPECGFHQRAWQLIDGLTSSGAEVTLFCPNGPRPARFDWNERSQASARARGVDLALSDFGVLSPDFWIASAWFTWQKRVRDKSMVLPSSAYFYRPMMARQWRNELERRRIDISIINFAYWSRLATLSRQRGIPVMIDMIDLLTDQLVATEKSLKNRSVDPEYLKRFLEDEIRCLNNSESVLAINPDESQKIRGRLNVPVIDLPFCLPRPGGIQVQHRDIDILIIGSNNIHNQNGLREFMGTAWKQIVEADPNVKLAICGRVGEGIAQNSNVSVHFGVPDLGEFYQRAKIVLLVSNAGAGIKIKTIEALAYGSCIVTHRHNIHGIKFEPQRHGFVVDSLSEAAKPILELLKNPDVCQRLRENASALFSSNFDTKHGRSVLVGEVLRILGAKSETGVKGQRK